MFDQIITTKMVGQTIAEAFPDLKATVIEKADQIAVNIVTRDELLSRELEGCARAFEVKTGLPHKEVTEVKP